MPRNLPNYTEPPVGEVVLSLQFEKLQKLDVLQLSLLSERFRDRFPELSAKPTVEHSIEEFLPPCSKLPSDPKIIFENQPPASRLWFRSSDGTQLIQAQNDRFLRNWIKNPNVDDGEYPRYETLKDDFFKQLEIFESFLVEKQLGELVPDQVEVTYINHIYPADDKWNLGRVLTVYSPHVEGRNLLEPETVNLKTSHLIHDEEHKPIGRLHVNAFTACNRENGEQLIRMDLTTRGCLRIHDAWKTNVSEFMDIGRKTIVNMFTELTTGEYHEIWGRTE